MIQVACNKTKQVESTVSVEDYLDHTLEGTKDVSAYDSSHSDLDNGNYLDLLKLITLKLCAANIISEQELLNTLGKSNSWDNPYFKVE